VCLAAMSKKDVAHASHAAPEFSLWVSPADH
jgi:hypothetical protein